MHAFTRPSSQLGLKVRDALLRSLHHSSLYRRLIIANKEKEDRTKTVGKALRKKLTRSPWEGTSLLNKVHIRATFQWQISQEIRPHPNK